MHRKTSRLIGKVIVYSIICVLGSMYIFPFIWMISTSFKTSAEVLNWPPNIIPKVWDFTNYPAAMAYLPFLLYFENTFIYAIASVIGTTLSCSLVAYGFSRIQWRWRDKVFILVLATMMLPSQITLIPTYIIFSTLKWVGTFKPLIVPTFFGSAFFIFMLRQFFLTIPMELSEASRIDGCSEMRTFIQIILPLAKPAVASVALFRFMDSWNDFSGPLIYLTNHSKYTVTVALAQFVGNHGTKWGMLMAASALVTLPIVILFFLTQKTFIEGIATTGLKG